MAKLGSMAKLSLRKKEDPLAIYDDITIGLRETYKKALLPLEKEYRYHDMHSPMLEDPDFDGKPLVMLIGQYSTGKTTFIRYLLENDFPGMRIGPEPTTDNFHIISHGDEEGKTPGNVLSVDASKPFRHLQQFGGTFLTRFEASHTPAEVLKTVTLLDTPGILAGEKQLVNRGYDFTGVLRWFAERADRIILLFDAHKLDISDEFKNAIQAIRKNEDKIRIVLNKADMMTHQQLMRVYGALMWSLSRILQAPEVSRVYVGSFWNQPLQHTANRDLFAAEQEDLFDDLQSLPRFATVRRLNDLIKRARSTKVHALLISHLKSQIPLVGKDRKKAELIKHLDEVYLKLQDEHNIPAADFPDVDVMREKLKKFDFSKFSAFNKSLIAKVDQMISEDVPRIMSLIPAEDIKKKSVGGGLIQGGVFEKVEMPFGEGLDAGKGEVEWIVARDKPKYDEVFQTLEQNNGKITGRVARDELLKSRLTNNILGKIWRLADTDADGLLDDEEFALAQHLIKLKIAGHTIPDSLPAHLIPPRQRAKMVEAGKVNGEEEEEVNGQSNGVNGSKVDGD